MEVAAAHHHNLHHHHQSQKAAPYDLASFLRSGSPSISSLAECSAKYSVLAARTNLENSDHCPLPLPPGTIPTPGIIGAVSFPLDGVGGCGNSNGSNSNTSNNNYINLKKSMQFNHEPENFFEMKCSNKLQPSSTLNEV